jgi:hypothetical protein
MKALKVVFVDIERAPLSRRGKIFSEYAALVEAGG